MILRAALALGTVWLMVPHQPEIGFSDDACAACVAASPANLDRDTIFQRLRQVRGELKASGARQIESSVGEEREAAVQNVPRLPNAMLSRLEAIAKAAQQ